MMARPLTISTDELRTVFTLLVDHLESEGKTSFTITEDYFWDVPQDQIYKVSEWPSQLTIGQLTESWGWLEDVKHGEREPLGYHLVWLAQILRFIGQIVVG